MASISLRNVSKSYGSVHILKDFSLDVADGEFIVLVGPSGCGKSTTLKILAGLDDATSGTVLIGGRDVTDFAPADRDIAMVFQNYALYPHMTVRKNMGFGLKVRGMPAAQINERVEAVARTLGLGELLERRPRQLSGGQRQRVALGRAIVREPQAFLMDEPLSNLDAKLRVRMRAEISEIHRRFKVTTVYVTHDQTEAMTMADRIVIMHDGVIQQIATPDEMYARPANLFVASFIGSPSMNFFASTITTDGGKPAISLFSQTIAIGSDFARHAGRKVVVGLRPEHLALGEGPTTVSVTPRFVESLGSEKHVHIPIAPEDRVDVSIATDRDEQHPGDFVAKLTTGQPIPDTGRLTLSFSAVNLHFFDSMTFVALKPSER